MNRLHCSLYRFHQRRAVVGGNERVGGNAQVRGSNGPPHSLIEQLLSSEVAPPAATAPVRIRETSHDPSADNVVQQAIDGPEELQRQHRERQADQARRRRAAVSASQQERTRTLSGSGPVELNNLSVSAIAAIKKSVGQVTHTGRTGSAPRAQSSSVRTPTGTGSTGSAARAQPSSSPRKSSLDFTRRAGTAGAHTA
ncbi:hypothetical protein JG688_00016279 [Phytophthora aleatoria]|uniref:Uncharacterized protein n=1 Tax=Phytophthora aleatoria TaxID=2496075 RepID=A0A8J5IS65_9STRA|nr:hypothetical protein JG688_00016279 [Phytophthora aleatoria]